VSIAQAKAQADLVYAADWLAIWLRRHPRLTAWIVPSTCRENFFEAVDKYHASMLGHDEHGVDIPAQNDPEWRAKL
jgi:hypothetical protein